MKTGYPVYGASGFIGYIDTFNQKEDYIAIIKDGSGVGKLFFYKSNSSVLGTLTYLKSKDEKTYNIICIYYLLQTIDFSSYIKGSGIPHIYSSDYLKEVILFPNDPKEQQKIASCLYSLDELITAHTQKLAALKAHKKGLMQNLFPAEGETLPKLRFKEFKDSGEWEAIKLIDVTDKKVKWSFTGGPFGSDLKSSDFTPNGIRVIQLQNMGDGEFIDKNKIFTSIEKADELLSCNIYAEEIIISKMGDPVGRACLLPKSHKRYVMCSDGIRLVVDEKNFSKYFIFLLINSIGFRELVEKSATGSTRKRIGLDDLKNLPMIVPKKLEEQQKIACCLSTLDELITAQTKKIEVLKEHKKGLMQGLFPSIIEN